jgi:putative phage-type endonuclease
MIVQGTPEWHQARLGKVTASRVADATKRTKTGYSVERGNYMAELLAERLTGVPAEKFVNAAMAWGTEREPEARELYEFQTGHMVEQTGFHDHPSLPMAGASPDGLIGSVGLLEVKCPTTSTHLDTLMGGTAPERYLAQMHWQMACTGREWCDFVSFDPRMPSSMRLFVKRVERDAERIAELEAEVAKFLAELDAKVETLRAAYARDAA